MIGELAKPQVRGQLESLVFASLCLCPPAINPCVPVFEGVLILAQDKNLQELNQQAEFQRKTLEGMRKNLVNVPFVVEYDNGGGQIGTKENPEWTAYEKLLKSYHATLRAIAAQSGKPSEKVTGTGSPLLDFENKYSNIRVVKSA